MSSFIKKAKEAQQASGPMTSESSTATSTSTPISVPAANMSLTTIDGTYGTEASARKLTGRVALITGCTKGIGRATTIAHVKLGCKVAVNYSFNEKSAQALIDEELGSDNIFAIKGDAGDVNSIEQMVKHVREKFARIDILIPDAGILSMENVKGPYFLAQSAIPYVSKGSTIIFLSTSLCAASIITPPYSLYTSTKGAIEQVVRASSNDLAAQGIRVNAIAPGPTATDVIAFLSSDDAR